MGPKPDAQITGFTQARGPPYYIVDTSNKTNYIKKEKQHEKNKIP